MNPETVFSICNLLAISGWLLLIFAPRARWSSAIISTSLIPLLLAAAYSALVFMHWGESAGGFSTLAAVSQLFGNPWMLLAGWIHYLAFDLFIGTWEVGDSAKNGTPHLLVVPCLILTFLFGPIGLACYFILRTVRGSSIKSKTISGS